MKFLITFIIVNAVISMIKEFFLLFPWIIGLKHILTSNFQIEVYKPHTLSNQKFKVPCLTSVKNLAKMKSYYISSKMKEWSGHLVTVAIKYPWPVPGVYDQIYSFF